MMFDLETLQVLRYLGYGLAGAFVLAIFRTAPLRAGFFVLAAAFAFWLLR
jgi:hypothetical protein